jgi:hypothetical protein
MLAGNKLTALPSELSNCKELELLRISANKLDHIPDWLLSMPKLTWLAFAGNPLRKFEYVVDTVENTAEGQAKKENDEECTVASKVKVEEVQWSDLELGERIGEGASGVVHKAVWHRKQATGADNRLVSVPTPVAVKLFKGETTSDGLPVNEMEVVNVLGLCIVWSFFSLEFLCALLFFMI